MQQPFLISGIDCSIFEHDQKYSHYQGTAGTERRMRAKSCPGFPCRVSLEDIAAGEPLLAFNYMHHSTTSPYRASGPVFVRQPVPATPYRDYRIPTMLRRRSLSLRAYDREGMMCAASLVEGEDLETHLQDLAATHSVEYVHIHSAASGCFLCKAERDS